MLIPHYATQFLNRFRLPPRLYLQYGLAILLGLAGAAFYIWLRLPLPWILGPISACVLGTLFKIPIAAPPIPPLFTLAVIGALLGSTFAQLNLAHLQQWIFTVIGTVVTASIGATLCTLYFRAVSSINFNTAYFAAMPAGIYEMTTIAQGTDASLHFIALAQASRSFLMVMTLPFVILFLTGHAGAARPVLGNSIVSTPWTDELWLLVSVIIGMYVGRLLRMPSRLMFGPMLVSGAFHVTQISSFLPPIELVEFAQLMLGVSIGSRFVTVPRREIFATLGYSLGATGIMLSVTAAAAEIMSLLTGLPFVQILLSYSPGGVTEMSLVALTLGIEVPFVITHHLVRVLYVLGCALPLNKIANRYRTQL